MAQLDEYGSPYERLPKGFPQCGPGTSAAWNQPGLPQCSKNYAGWDQIYKPTHPPAPDYAQWPERLREHIPYAWSGDAIYRPARPDLTPEEAKNPANLVRSPYIFELEWNYQNADFLKFYVGHFISTLSDNGWGRYYRIRSNVTGEPGQPYIWGSKMTITTTFDVGGFFSTILRAIAKVVSFIPGVGTVAAAALAGIGALAAGENIGAALLDAAANAVPGGGLAKDALKTGVAVAKKLVEGGNFGEAALAGVKEVLKGQGVPVEVLQAFDVGVALGTGAGLQEVGFKAFALLSQGDDMLQRGLNYTAAVNKAVAKGIPVVDVLVDSLGTSLSRVPAPTETLAWAVDQIKADKSLLNWGSDELAAQLGIDEPAARGAQAIMRDGTEDVGMRERILETTTQKLFAKYGAQFVASKDAAVSLRDELRDRGLARSVVEDDSLKFAAQKAIQDAELVRAATQNYQTSFAYQYQQATGIDLTAQREIERRAEEERRAIAASAAEQRAAIAVTGSGAPRTSKSTIGQDIVLGLTVAGALGALYWWARGPRAA